MSFGGMLTGGDEEEVKEPAVSQIQLEKENNKVVTENHLSTN